MLGLHVVLGDTTRGNLQSARNKTNRIGDIKYNI